MTNETTQLALASKSTNITTPSGGNYITPSSSSSSAADNQMQVVGGNVTLAEVPIVDTVSQPRYDTFEVSSNTCNQCFSLVNALRKNVHTSATLLCRAV
jgi:hypothetical protein